MIGSAVVDRYARAVFELGAEHNQLEPLSKQLQAIAALYAQSRELRTALESPLIPEDERDGLLKELASRLGLGEFALNTVRLLASRRRLAALPDIARRLSGLADERAGVVRAKVTTAAPLPESFYQRLAQSLEKQTRCKVVLEREQDGSLIGGVITRIGDNTIDGSLRGRLDELERQLLRA